MQCVVPQLKLSLPLHLLSSSSKLQESKGAKISYAKVIQNSETFVVPQSVSTTLLQHQQAGQSTPRSHVTVIPQCYDQAGKAQCQEHLSANSIAWFQTISGLNCVVVLSLLFVLLVLLLALRVLFQVVIFSSLHNKNTSNNSNGGQRASL